jgi:hypothetical protein
VPADLASRTNIRLRNSFFGGGYAHSTPEAEEAIEFAKDQLGIRLESTYTGKAMAALLADTKEPESEGLNFLFWNTYYAMPVTVPTDHEPYRKNFSDIFPDTRLLQSNLSGNSSRHSLVDCDFGNWLNGNL